MKAMGSRDIPGLHAITYTLSKIRKFVFNNTIIIACKIVSSWTIDISPEDHEKPMLVTPGR